MIMTEDSTDACSKGGSQIVMHIKFEASNFENLAAISLSLNCKR